MVGFATLLMGGFSRFGVWREVAIAFAVLIAVDGIRGTLVNTVRSDASLWVLMYVPSAIGALLVLGMLWHLSHPAWFRRRRVAA
jgi:lipopolysaccharide export system permease protein